MFSLGGLDENGKNMFVIEVDKNIFVFEAGLKYADELTLGIDYIIPNVTYLKENKKRIKGIFLTHGHDENIGALTDIVDDLGNPCIYGSKYTLEIVKDEFDNSNIKYKNMKEIKAYVPIEIGNVKIFPVNLSHSTPDNFGYAIYTKDGVIFYASDYVIDSLMKGAYKTDIGKLAYIGKQNVLCLLTESFYAGVEGFTSPRHRIAPLIRETLNNSDGRIIFNVLDSHLYRIQELFTEVEKTNRKIVIMGKRLKKIIDFAIENHYLYISKDIIGDLSNINDKNVVILNANEKDKPYYNIMRIVNGYDKFIKFNEDDTVFLATPIYDNREKTFYSLLDDIAKSGANVVSLSSKKYLSHHASNEDLMTMINLMNPKYYFPIRGEYKNQVMNAELAEMVGIPKSNIILKENGDVVTFKNGKKMKEVAQAVPIDRILLETDSPYLAPEPNRGKRNSSLNIPYIAAQIAQIKEMEYEEVVNITNQNARRLFHINEQ